MNWEKTKPVSSFDLTGYFLFFFDCLNRLFTASVLVLVQLLTQSPDQVLPAGSRAKPGRIPYLLQGGALPCLHSPAHVSVSKVQFMASAVYGLSSFGSGKIPKSLPHNSRIFIFVCFTNSS